MCLFRKKDLGKIYTTTDGYFADNKRNKKKRHVVVVDQRKDGALAVSKLHTQKEGRKGCIDNLVLSPRRHKALKENTVVEKRVIHGVKRDGNYKPILRKELTGTKSRLGIFEFLRVKKGVGGSNRKDKRQYKNTRRKWHNYFGNRKRK